MKKIIAIVMVLTLAVALSACSAPKTAAPAATEAPAAPAATEAPAAPAVTEAPAAAPEAPAAETPAA